MSAGHYIAVAGLLGLAFSLGWLLALWVRDRGERTVEQWLAERDNAEISFTE